MPTYITLIHFTQQGIEKIKEVPTVGYGSTFWSVHGVIQNLFRVGRHLLRSANHRMLRAHSLLVWHEVTCA